MSTKIEMQEWLDIFRQATQEVSAGALKFEESAAGSRAPAAAKPKPAARGAAAAEDDKPHPGAYISLMSETASVHLGLTATKEGGQTLARSLLGLHPTQPVSDQEVGDAVSELMNIIAGKVKSRVSERDPSIQLGLPMFIQGRIQETGSMERKAAEVQVGPVSCGLLVYRNKRAA